MSVLAEVTLPNGEPIDIWDLHVGAQMRLLGKRITLQKVGAVKGEHTKVGYFLQGRSKVALKAN